MSKYGEVEYIGGGIYAQPMPGGGVNILVNHHRHPTDRAWLDAGVVRALMDLLERVKTTEPTKMKKTSNSTPISTPEEKS